MKPISKKILTIILAFMVLSLFVGEVQAADDDDNDDSLIVSIESANYLDLDEDQLEDDIITEFTIAVPKGNWDFDRTLVYCKITLPSGAYFNYLFLLIGSYNSVSLTIGWYNTALELGWYEFEVYAWGLGSEAPDMGSDWVIFDPPGGGDPAPPPIVEIIDIVAE